MDQLRRTANLLASVTDEREARLCVSLGADIIDAKNPAAGALGALDHASVRAIRDCVPSYLPLSATIGDPPPDAGAAVAAVRAMAATGVDIVKIGLKADAATRETLSLLRSADVPARLVGVLLIEPRGDVALGLVDQARAAGFVGVMLDTARKDAGPLTDLVSMARLRGFISAAHRAGLFAGLAGSLRVTHVPHLLSLQPDVLGFRGGLCREGERTSTIDKDAMRRVRSAMPTGAQRLELGGRSARRKAAGER
jgi:uncharacterized protein (UPF0264 family)